MKSFKCSHCKAISPPKSGVCLNCGGTFLPVDTSKPLIKPLSILDKARPFAWIAIFVVTAILVPILYFKFDENLKKETQENEVNKKIAEKNNKFITEKLSQDFRENFQITTWFKYWRGLSVDGNQVNVTIANNTPLGAAESICGAISAAFLYDVEGDRELKRAVIYDENQTIVMTRYGVKPCS